MRPVRAGQLRDRLQFFEAVLVDDGVTDVAEFQPVGGIVRGRKTDVSDGEAWRASQISDHVTSRFVVRSTVFTRGITAAHRLTCDDVTYEVTGIKEVPNCNGRFLEINAASVPKE